jgi:hypothetical protein
MEYHNNPQRIGIFFVLFSFLATPVHAYSLGWPWASSSGTTTITDKSTSNTGLLAAFAGGLCLGITGTWWLMRCKRHTSGSQFPEVKATRAKPRIMSKNGHFSKNTTVAEDFIREQGLSDMFALYQMSRKPIGSALLANKKEVSTEQPD